MYICKNYCIAWLYIHSRQIYQFYRVYDICDQSDLPILTFYNILLFFLKIAANECVKTATKRFPNPIYDNTFSIYTHLTMSLKRCGWGCDGRFQIQKNWFIGSFWQICSDYLNLGVKFWLLPIKKKPEYWKYILIIYIYCLIKIKVFPNFNLPK